MRYWVCQSCKTGCVNETKPTVCENCGKVGGEWKSSATANMRSFKMYICEGCDLRVVEERQPPTYPCDMCGKRKWKIFNGY